MSTKAGFTLAELVVGSGILIMVLAGLYATLVQSTILSDNVQSSDFAGQVLQAEMEELLMMKWNRIEKVPKQATFDPHKYFSEIPLKDYECLRQITEIEKGLLELRLSVSWHDIRGKKNSRELVTYYAEGGMYDSAYTSF